MTSVMISLTGDHGRRRIGCAVCNPFEPSTTDGAMRLDPDCREFIECCTAREVRFLIVGGYALAAHGHRRFTKDRDVWLWLDQANSRHLVEALDDFGFGSLGLSENDFADPNTVVQLGRAPKRIDLEAYQKVVLKK